MKRNINLKRAGGLIAVCSLLGITFSSCLKDNSPGSVNFGDSPALISYQYQGFGATTYTESVLPLASQTVSTIEVTLSVASVTLSKPVTFTVAEDDAGAAAQIAADVKNDNTVKEAVLPASQYTIANGGKFTISPGQQIIKIPITYAGNTINWGAVDKYVLDLKLTSPNGAQVTSNLNDAITYVVLRSLFEGTYNAKGFVYRSQTGAPGGPNYSGTGGYFTNHSTFLGTVSADVLSYSPTWADNSAVGGIDGTTITLDPVTNKVTMASSTNSSLQNVPGYNNRYDPATKTFYLSFMWSGGGREITDTLVNVGP